MGENLERTQVCQFPIGNLILKKKIQPAQDAAGEGTQQFPPPKWVQLATEEQDQGKAQKVAQRREARPGPAQGQEGGSF